MKIILALLGALLVLAAFLAISMGPEYLLPAAGGALICGVAYAVLDRLDAIRDSIDRADKNNFDVNQAILKREVGAAEEAAVENLAEKAVRQRMAR